MIIFDPVYSPEPNEEFRQFEVSSEEEPQLASVPALPETKNTSRETFLQSDNCFNTSRSIKHCYECVDDPDTNKYSCRFFEFRKLERENKKHKVVGFLDPHIDPTAEDLALWTLADKSLEVDQQTTDYILTYIASDFCEMVDAEIEVSKNSKPPAWKRSVLQVREMCDVCDTSVFNFHWTCKYCGLCVCIDCSKERKADIIRFKRKTKAEKEERDKFFWIRCPHKSNHEKMMLTQMATGSSLVNLNQNLHKICEKRNITQRCGCSLRTNSCLKIESKRMLQENLPNRNKSSLLELRTLMKSQRHKMKAAMKRRLSLIEQQKLNQVKHTFVAQTQVLKIIEPSESVDCYKLFQNHWEKGVPVVVANVTRKMRKEIWSPEYFSQKFGHEKHTLVNCKNSVTINRVAMKVFWDGFGSIQQRIPLNSLDKIVLKLKDWPTSDDFADVLKEHFEDIVAAFPLAAYTRRDGKFNLARYLPSFFSRPDLGPKMYSAYSQAHPATQGSTNLHLDVSDAINVMVHVGKPADAHLLPSQYSLEAILSHLISAGADAYDKNHLCEEKLPGAIWHIFPAHQADEMRKVLVEVAAETGHVIGENDDPIHDQSWYIDEGLRKRMKGKGITSYTIVQYEGDAVFIPAGAPHQVINLLDCIKVALDFVAPENLTECLNLTEEFRALSTRHENREDKLQIKNILYHTIKNLLPLEADVS